MELNFIPASSTLAISTLAISTLFYLRYYKVHAITNKKRSAGLWINGRLQYCLRKYHGCISTTQQPIKQMGLDRITCTSVKTTYKDKIDPYGVSAIVQIILLTSPWLVSIVCNSNPEMIYSFEVQSYIVLQYIILSLKYHCSVLDDRPTRCKILDTH